jgi:hypothetical protein
MNGKSHDRKLRKFKYFFQFPGQEIKVADYGYRCYLHELFVCNSRDRESQRTKIFALSFGTVVIHGSH